MSNPYPFLHFADPSSKHNFCILYQDSSDMWSCNYCKHIICSRCITVHHAYLEVVSESDVKFECICYHWLKSGCTKTQTPYWVSHPSTTISFSHHVHQLVQIGLLP